MCVCIVFICICVYIYINILVVFFSVVCTHLYTYYFITLAPKKTESIRHPNTILANRWLESSLIPLAAPCKNWWWPLNVAHVLIAQPLVLGDLEGCLPSYLFCYQIFGPILEGLLSVKIGRAQNVIRAFNFVILFLKLTFSHLKILGVDSDEGILLGVAAFWQVRTLSFREHEHPPEN